MISLIKRHLFADRAQSVQNRVTFQSPSQAQTNLWYMCSNLGTKRTQHYLSQHTGGKNSKLTNLKQFLAVRTQSKQSLTYLPCI